mmetsp:Transcript_30415/g.62706  ORF Transcript_30415/g.62706 Transcript_30415/m.62706 type:complete len:122 (-) Transcript_30415:2204-2569(-)
MATVTCSSRRPLCLQQLPFPSRRRITVSMGLACDNCPALRVGTSGRAGYSAGGGKQGCPAEIAATSTCLRKDKFVVGTCVDPPRSLGSLCARQLGERSEGSHPHKCAGSSSVCTNLNAQKR